MSKIRSCLVGCGSYLPSNKVTNKDLEKKLDTSDAWIRERTGIAARHVAAEGEWTSHLATKAAQAALDDAGIPASEVDMIVLATATPDRTFPSTATAVQANLGITKGSAFDVQAVCSGFVYGLTVADSLIRAEQASTVVVIGAETFSRILDWTDRTTCVLFGDGAGAFVLQAKTGQGTNQDKGILANYIRSDGRYTDLLYVDGGPSSTKTVGHLRMQGKEVFRHAVGKISEAITAALRQADLTIDDVDWFVPHQANVRILDATAKRVGLSPEKVIVSIEQHGNTSAASVPLAYDLAVKDGRIKPGDVVLVEAMGGGLTWGSSLIRV